MTSNPYRPTLALLLAAAAGLGLGALASMAVAVRKAIGGSIPLTIVWIAVALVCAGLAYRSFVHFQRLRVQKGE